MEDFVTSNALYLTCPAYRQELTAGDLVEFDRGIYQHWAVYVGLQDCPETGRTVHCVVHRYTYMCVYII